MVIHFFIMVGQIIEQVFRVSIIALTQVVIFIGFRVAINIKIIINIMVSSFKSNFMLLRSYFDFVNWINFIKTDKNFNFKLIVVSDFMLEQ